MIARIWHGVTPEHKAEEYAVYCLHTGVKDLRATDGNRGVYLLRMIRDGKAEFLVISLWDPLDCIQEFSGPDVEKAHYYPRDEEFLDEFEPQVNHFEVLAD